MTVYLDCEGVIELLERAEYVALDTETSGEDIRDGRGYLVGLSVAYGELSGYLPIRHINELDGSNTNLTDDERYRLTKAIENYKGWLIFHNSKFDLESLRSAGINYTGKFYDTMLMAHLINENKPYTKSLDGCTKHYVGKDSKKKSEAFLAAQKIWGWNMPASVMYEYAAYDAVLTFRLFEAIKPLFDEEELAETWEHKQKFVRTIIAMERRGVRVDTALAKRMQIHGEMIMDDIREELKLNPGSTKDLKVLLIDKLGLPVVKATPAGAPSFDKEAMAVYDRALELQENHTAELITAYRGWQKSVSSNYIPYQELLSPDGRLRPNYKLHGTKTGRMSCVSADTLIEMPRNLVEYPDGIPITEVKEGDWVYCFDWKRRLTLKRVKWVGQTGVKLTYLVTLQNSAGDTKTLRLTPEHLVRLYHGDWRPAGSLMHKAGQPTRYAGPRVMHMVKRQFDNGYVKFFPNSVASGNGMISGGINREHRFVLEKVTGKKISTKYDVHHIDGNKANNHPSNLEAIPYKLHRGHKDVGYGKAYSEHYTGPVNYRVVSVQPAKVEPVWDMEIEDVHNFIANGVCVHNCEKPNLQQIPRSGDKAWNGEMKSTFIPEEGYELYEADYSQLELRLGTAYAGEEGLKRIFAEGRDVFTEMSNDLGMSRQNTKTLVYTIQYGGGINRISTVFAVSRERAEQLRENYFSTYPGFHSVAMVATQKAKHVGKLKLWSGRYRHFLYPREEAHKAFNSVIQGGAADIVERTMVRCFESVDNDEECRMLLQVHDSIVWEIKKDKVDKYLPMIKEAMTNIEPDFGVTFAVDIHKFGE